jgi:hypothetical protein
MTSTVADGLAGAAVVLALAALVIAVRTRRTVRKQLAARQPGSVAAALAGQPASQPRSSGPAQPNGQVQHNGQPKPSAPRAEPARPPVKGEIARLREDVAALRLDMADALRHLAVVRYDAFGDMGGQLSWSMALLDDHGNGVVLTSINGRSDARSYAKNVREFVCESKVSPEEAEAIEYLRKEAAGTP